MGSSNPRSSDAQRFVMDHSMMAADSVLTSPTTTTAARNARWATLAQGPPPVKPSTVARTSPRPKQCGPGPSSGEDATTWSHNEQPGQDATMAREHVQDRDQRAED